LKVRLVSEESIRDCSRSRETSDIRTHATCHMSILNVSPSFLLTPRAAEGS
jgi:hypothetical protein